MTSKSKVTFRFPDELLAAARKMAVADGTTINEVLRADIKQYVSAAAPTDSGALKELRTIPSVGPSLARDLLGLGIRRVADLKGRDPQALYDQLCNASGQHHDRCVLYTFRCAVYFASTAKPDPEKLKWWNWKDGPAISLAARKAAAKRGLKPAGA